MTREEAIEYLKDERSNAVCDERYTAEWVDVLDMAIKALGQEQAIDKPHIKGDYYDGYKNGLRTTEWRCGKIRKEINQLPITDTAIRLINEIFDKYMDESEMKK